MYIFLIPIITFLFAINSFSQTTDAAKVEFEEFNLDNGLHVILHKDNTNPIVSVDIWYHVGAKDEDPGRTGFAHLFEHIMFQGSKNVGKTEHFTYVQKAGGTLNGTTNQDRTNYFETVPSNRLDLALWLESDRMSTLNVTQENFDNQREVVKEEKRQRYDNVPYGTRWGNLFSMAFKGQTYEWIPIGSMEDLNNADLGYAQSFYKKFYSPDDAVLVVSGDINYDEAKKEVQKYFGDLKAAKTERKLFPEVIYNQGEKRDTVFEKVQLPALYIGYKIPGTASNDIYALEMLSSILSSGKSSRLYKKIVYENKGAKSVNSFLYDNELAGLFIISGTGFKTTNLGELEKKVTEEIDKMKNELVTASELEKVKNSAEADFTNRLQTTMGKADMLAEYWTYHKNTGLINTRINNFLSITPQEIMDAAKKYLNPENRVVLYYLPKPESKSN